jgi:hypothetical protein
MMWLHIGTLIGIPRRKTPRNDMITGKMNSHLIQAQSDIVCYVNFPLKMEETHIY